MSVKKDIMWRIGLVYFGVLAFAFAIIFRVVQLQLIQGHKWVEKANAITLKDISIEPNRGNIYDCNGKVLATSVPYYEIRLDFSHATLSEKDYYSGIDSLAFRLSSLFGDKPARTYKKELAEIRREGRRYHLFKRKLSYQDLKAIKNFPIFRLGKNKGGFIVIQENVRFQPYVTLASRTIGYLSKSEEGNTVGIEGAYDEYLKGITGIKIMQKIAGGYWMPVENENEVDPTDGHDIVTSIDINIQDVAESALRKQLSRHGAHHGTAILMEVSSGEIRAIVNLERDANGNYRESYNYALGESTEPGSTFKLPVLMAAMEDGYINLEDSIETGKGKITFYDKTIKDSEEDGYGKITVKDVFEVSSNVGVAKIITDYYKGREKQFIDRLYSFRLNKKLGLDIKGEGEPYIKYPGDKTWSGITLPMLSHGYELVLTPLQILTFYNAVANDGCMVKPIFVKEIWNHGNVERRFTREVLNPSVCSSATIKMAKEMLEGVVEEGTANNLKNKSYRIAGKTGTAQVANVNAGYRSEARIRYQASFVGYFPAQNPKYSCIVVINNPSSGVYYGNVIAGPVFKEIADKVFATYIGIEENEVEMTSKLESDPPYSKAGNKEEIVYALKKLGIPYQWNTEKASCQWLYPVRDSLQIQLNRREIINNIVPNVQGMSLKDAVFLMENAGLKVKTRGYGTVRSQSITPGNSIARGQLVELIMTQI